MAAESLLFEVGVLFAAVALVGAIANRLDQSVIPFYILAGMALSPYVLGGLSIPIIGGWYIQETTFVSLGAELGIVFLLFFLGLEFNLDRLIESKDRIGRAGTIDLVVNFGVGLGLGYVLFGAALPALLFAGIVYISSSAIITKSLIDRGWIANDEAGPILGTLVYEDLFIAVYLAVVSALVLGGGDLQQAAVSIGISIGFILLLLGLVIYGSAPFERLLTTDSSEFFLLRAIGITIFVAGAALALGVSEAVAAFFVGMTFSATSHVDQLEHRLEPIRDAFAAVFFFWIGLVTDPSLFGAVAGLVAIAVVVTAPAKFCSGYLGGRVYDLSVRRSTRVGLGMVTRGEFSLIIASVAIAEGTRLSGPVADDLYAFTVAYVLCMSIIGTMVMQYSAPFERLMIDWVEDGSTSH